MKQTIGLVYDLRKDYLAQGFSEDQVAEFDSEETIDSLHAAIESLGFNVRRIGNARALCGLLVAGFRPDLVFNIAEGLAGRNREAQVPAILELYDIPYTLSDPLVCAATLDKAVTKKLLLAENIPTPAFFVVDALAGIDGLDLNWPLFAKPVAEGTGKGIDANSMLNSRTELVELCTRLLEQYRQPVLVEEFLPGREFTVGLLGTGHDSYVLGTMEIQLVQKDAPAIYSLLNKEECESRIIYSRLDDSDPLKPQIEQIALASHRALQCRDASRVDIRCDKNNQPSFIELNPLPGLHPTHSDLPMIATQEGMSYQTLLGTIIESAFKRKTMSFLQSLPASGGLAPPKGRQESRKFC